MKQTLGIIEQYFTGIQVAHLFLSNEGISCCVRMGFCDFLYYREGLYNKKWFFIVFKVWLQMYCYINYCSTRVEPNYNVDYIYVYIAFFLGIQSGLHYKVIRAPPV